MIINPRNEQIQNAVRIIIDELLKSNGDPEVVANFIVNAIYHASKNTKNENPANIKNAPCSVSKWIALANEIYFKMQRYVSESKTIIH